MAPPATPSPYRFKLPEQSSFSHSSPRPTDSSQASQQQFASRPRFSSVDPRSSTGGRQQNQRYQSSHLSSPSLTRRGPFSSFRQPWDSKFEGIEAEGTKDDHQVDRLTASRSTDEVGDPQLEDTASKSSRHNKWLPEKHLEHSRVKTAQASVSFDDAGLGSGNAQFVVGPTLDHGPPIDVAHSHKRRRLITPAPPFSVYHQNHDEVEPSQAQDKSSRAKDPISISSSPSSSSSSASRVTSRASSPTGSALRSPRPDATVGTTRSHFQLYAVPPSSPPRQITNSSKPSRPKFLIPPSSPISSVAPPPSVLFSPHRRGAGATYIPNGMAETVQRWAVETWYEHERERREEIEFRVGKVSYEAGGGWVLVREAERGHRGWILVGRGRAVRDEITEGVWVTVSGPRWDVEIGSEEDGKVESWAVGVIWRVMREEG